MKRYMLRFILVLLVFDLSSSHAMDKKIAGDNESIQQFDIDDKEPIFSGHPISFYLAHTQIPQVCKDLYSGKRQPSDEVDILSLLDSIFTSNVETRPFYFLTITHTMEKADGAYAEPLGMMGKQFVEEHSKEFVDYFINNSLLTNKDFEEWAKTVAGEIEISASDQEKEELERLKNKMTLNCDNCSNRQSKMINNFLDRVKYYSLNKS